MAEALSMASQGNGLWEMVSSLKKEVAQLKLTNAKLVSDVGKRTWEMEAKDDDIKSEWLAWDKAVNEVKWEMNNTIE